MISFSQLGKYGRLGNQLFQYAFLRTQAEKLGVQFYCPEWIGDKIFDLDDQKERVWESKTIYQYYEGDRKHGFNIEATKIKDSTDIFGYFQTDKYFSRADILKWFSFKEGLFADVKKKYQQIDFSKSVAIHLRMGDYMVESPLFYIARQSYFKKALSLVKHRENILVFSDSPDAAKKFLNFLPVEAVFIGGNKDFEDLYLMTLCHDMICSASSFSWWGAYLNHYPDKVVIAPEYLFRPDAPTVNKDIFYVKGWTNLPAHHFYDNYFIKYIPIKIAQLYRRFFKS